MNKIIVSGNLTRDSELKFTGGGKAVLNFSIAVSDGYGDNKKVSFWNCALWGARAEKLAEHFTKGTKLLVEGKPELRQYETNDGVKRIAPEIFVQDFDFIGGKNDQQQSGGSQDNSQDFIPF